MKNKFWTARYAAINIFYFAGFAATHAYASVFLIAKGFSNSTIGIILAVANITSIAVQAFVAALIDKGGRATNRNSIMVSLLFMIAMAVTMAFASTPAVIFIAFAMCYMLQMMIQPIISAMNFEYRKMGCNINFGLARGLGSCGFAIASPIIGLMVANISADVIPWLFVVTQTICFLFTLTFIKKGGNDGAAESMMLTDTREEDLNASGTTEPEEAPNTNLLDFIRCYPRFCLYILAVTCFFFGHNAINDYMIQIITPLGGDETTLGYLVAVAAFLELPVMSIYVFLTKKFRSSTLLKFSGVMFFVKVLIMYLAPNIPVATVSMCCQLFAYALYIPANAYYATEVMKKNDQVKGQAYSSAAITLGGTFSGLVCGRIIDASGTKTMLLVATAVALVGVIIAMISVAPGRSGEKASER